MVRAFTVGVCVGSCDIWRPVANRLGSITPGASFFSTNSGRVDVVALQISYMVSIREG